MSKNTPLTSRSLSKDWYIVWVIERIWFMQESPGQRSDWLDDNTSFSLKNLLNKSLSKILLKIRSKETGWQFLMHCLSFFFFLQIRTTLAFFYSIGNFIWLRHDLKIIERGLHKEGPHSFNIWILTISWPWPWLGSRLCIILIIFSFDIWTLLRRFPVRNSTFFGALQKMY